MAAFQTSNGLLVLVDDADLHSVIQYPWHARKRTPSSSRYYVIRGRRAGEDEPQTVYLHRWLVKPARGFVVDHINGDGLDNRRVNLRQATTSQNAANGKTTWRGSFLRGVAAYQKAWRAEVTLDGHRKRGPSRNTAIHAAFDYDRIARQRFGEFASLHFPCVYQELDA